MKFADDQAAIDFIIANQATPQFITDARTYSAELKALINGKLFIEELIKRIEHIESEEKAKARKKYSRNIVDFFERLLLPISNVFSSPGGSVKFNIKNNAELTKFLKEIASIRDGKSVKSYVENQFMPVYHNDPNGVIFMEYTTIPNVKVYPTYKAISAIRNYVLKGQQLDVILFEPKKTKKGGLLWRIVDDAMDRTILQEGKTYSIVTDPKFTFEHPFGEVPGFVNSDILDVDSGMRVSPIHKVIDLSKEYARDQSVKTLYKFLQGFPTHWRYVTQCKTCTGLGKINQRKEGAAPGVFTSKKIACSDCDGFGYYKKKDVTDMITLPAPDANGVKVAPDIAGFISPDLETWGKYSEELKLLEIYAQDTHWGTHVEPDKNNQTATGRFIDIQPVNNKLNKYADMAEWVDWRITEWVGNVIVITKPKNENIALIVYGRRFILDSPDTLLERYNKSRIDGDNAVILDRLFDEYITAKYKSDPEWLYMENLKAKLEPYLHLTPTEVNTLFGPEEAFKKVWFQKWFAINEDKISEMKSYSETEKLFEAEYLKAVKPQFPTAPNSQQPPIPGA